MSDIINNAGALQLPGMSFISSIPEPWRTAAAYAIFIVIAFVACVVLAAVLKFLLKFIFHQIRFFICLVIAILLIGGFLVKSAVAPVQSFIEETGVNDAMALAVDKFKGLYSGSEPLLAWRFTDITGETDDAMSAFEDSSEEQNDESNKVRIRIDYLPAGSVVVVYDKATHTFSLDKDITDE